MRKTYVYQWGRMFYFKHVVTQRDIFLSLVTGKLKMTESVGGVKTSKSF